MKGARSLTLHALWIGAEDEEEPGNSQKSVQEVRPIDYDDFVFWALYLIRVKLFELLIPVSYSEKYKNIGRYGKKSSLTMKQRKKFKIDLTHYRIENSFVSPLLCSRVCLF